MIIPVSSRENVEPIADRWSTETLARSLGSTREWVTSNIKRLGIAPAFRTGASVFYGAEAYVALRVLLELQRMVDEPRSSIPFKIVQSSREQIRTLAARPNETAQLGLTNGTLTLSVALSMRDLIPQT